MDKEVAVAYVRDLLVTYLNISPDTVSKAKDDNMLTGSPIWISALDMAYLFLEIEKRLNISISPEYLVDYGFNTINRIAECIAACSN